MSTTRPVYRTGTSSVNDSATDDTDRSYPFGAHIAATESQMVTVNANKKEADPMKGG